MGEIGDCLANFDGETIGVFGGIPGELVKARIYRYRRRKRSMVTGMVSQVIEPSPHRLEVPCPNFGPCSGCQWQHIDYQHQLELKRGIVSDSFSSYSTLGEVNISPTLPAPSQFEYRNHARFTVRFGGQMGFSNRITRRFVRIENCMLMAPEINEVLGATINQITNRDLNNFQIPLPPTKAEQKAFDRIKYIQTGGPGLGGEVDMKNQFM